MLSYIYIKISAWLLIWPKDQLTLLHSLLCDFVCLQANKVVEGRRKVLEKYLRSLINLILENNQRLANSVCKQTLIDVIPFFR